MIMGFKGFQRKAISEDTEFGRAMGEVTNYLKALIEPPEEPLQRAITNAMHDVVDELAQSMNDIESARRKMELDLQRLDERHEGDFMTSADFPITYSWGSHLERSVAKHETTIAAFFRIYHIGCAAGIWGER